MRILFILILIICTSACQNAGNQSAPKKIVAENPAAIQNSNLYMELGGRAAIENLVSKFMIRLHQDPRLSELFEEIDDDDTNRHLSDFLCRLTGGDCIYHGVDLVEIHSGMEISKAEFDHFVSLFILTMQNVEIPFSNQNKLLALLAALRPDIIEI